MELIRQQYRRFSTLVSQPRIVITLVLLFVLLIPPAVQAQEDTLHVSADQQVQSDIATARRDIIVDGVVAGDVTTWSGDITINGHVQGDVVSYSGTIELGPLARVDGHVLALAGGVTEIAGAQVAGQLIGDESVGSGAVASLIDLFGQPQHTGENVVSNVLVSLALTFIALLLVAASVWRWPLRTEGIRRTLVAMPWRSLALGLLTTLLLAVLLVPLSVVLAVTLIGLPLILALVLFLQLPYIYGLAVISQVVGQRLLPFSQQTTAVPTTVAGAVLLLIPLLGLGMLAPLWGACVFYMLSSVGLGAAILSRGGVFAPLAYSV